MAAEPSIYIRGLLPSTTSGRIFGDDSFLNPPFRIAAGSSKPSFPLACANLPGRADPFRVLVERARNVQNSAGLDVRADFGAGHGVDPTIFDGVLNFDEGGITMTHVRHARGVEVDPESKLFERGGAGDFCGPDNFAQAIVVDPRAVEDVLTESDASVGLESLTDLVTLDLDRHSVRVVFSPVNAAGTVPFVSLGRRLSRVIAWDKICRAGSNRNGMSSLDEESRCCEEAARELD